MLESHLNEGNQSADLAHDALKYGVSVTDACIDFETTSQLMALAFDKLNGVLVERVNKSANGT
jgi:3-deoxy-7-phosphoheptulonate synthase